jgi:hypothetical protein
MPDNVAAVHEIYELARRTNHTELRMRLHDEVTWHPAREGAWKPLKRRTQKAKNL